jgi:acetylserotonin N-methyltransferase
MNLPDPAPVLDLIDAFRRSKTMFAAHGMGIFDLLHQCSAGAADVAQSIKADPAATARLLDGCAALGLLVKTGDTYSNAPVADTYLWSGSPHSLGSYVRYSDEALYLMWAHLDDAVREAGPRWKQTFGFDGPLFSSFFHTDAAMREFLRGMHGFGMLTSPKVVRAFDLSGFQHLADLGGATGHLAIAACEAYPNLRATIFDLPRVAPLAREYAAESPARDRLTVAEGDFFTDDLPAADLFTLGRILHDWSPGKIEILLRKIFDRLPSGGALLLAEKLFLEDAVGPVHVNMQDLNMLVCTEGKERTFSQYRDLLEAVGLRSSTATLPGSLGVRCGCRRHDYNYPER